MTEPGYGPNVHNTQILCYVRVKLAIISNYHFHDKSLGPPLPPLSPPFLLFWVFSQATEVQIENGWYRCIQHLEP